MIPRVHLFELEDRDWFQTRAPDELQALAASLGEVGYRWNTGKVRRPGSPAHLTYLIGLPERQAA